MIYPTSSTSTSTSTSAPTSDGRTSPFNSSSPVRRLPPGAAPSSFNKYQGLGINTPDQNSYHQAAQHEPRVSSYQLTDGYGSKEGYHESMSVERVAMQGDRNVDRDGMGWNGGRQRSGSQTRMERKPMEQGE